jgi:protein TonB
MADDPEVVAPSCLKCPVDYPPIAERLQVQGDVEMRILVSGEGRVVKTEVLSGHRDLRNGAEASVRKWIYRPATKRGRPGMIWLIVTVRFNLS